MPDTPIAHPALADCLATLQPDADWTQWFPHPVTVGWTFSTTGAVPAPWADFLAMTPSPDPAYQRVHTAIFAYLAPCPEQQRRIAYWNAHGSFAGWNA